MQYIQQGMCTLWPDNVVKTKLQEVSAKILFSVYQLDKKCTLSEQVDNEW